MAMLVSWLVIAYEPQRAPSFFWDGSLRRAHPSPSAVHSIRYIYIYVCVCFGVYIYIYYNIIVDIYIYTSWWFETWLLWLSIYWECHHPNWRIYHQPVYIYIPMFWQFVKVGWPKCPKHEWVDEWEHLQEMIVLSCFIMFFPQIESVIQFCRIRVYVKRIFHGHLWDCTWLS